MQKHCGLACHRRRRDLCRTSLLLGAIDEESEEHPGFRGGLHREVDVLGGEDRRVRRPAARVADVREACADGIGC